MNRDFRTQVKPWGCAQRGGELALLLMDLITTGLNGSPPHLVLAANKKSFKNRISCKRLTPAPPPSVLHFSPRCQIMATWASGKMDYGTTDYRTTDLMVLWSVVSGPVVRGLIVLPVARASRPLASACPSVPCFAFLPWSNIRLHPAISGHRKFCTMKESAASSFRFQHFSVFFMKSTLIKPNPPKKS